jgi:hypothetical protein
MQTLTLAEVITAARTAYEAGALTAQHQGPPTARVRKLVG